MVELLARLHLAGLYWGDCSLSNTLFRPDAGTIAAYLVDAETAEMHPTLSDGQRHGDIDYAAERVGGELFDLQDGGLLPADVDPIVGRAGAAAALSRAVGRADPRGGLPPRRTALPRRGARRAAQPARLRRRRAGAPRPPRTAPGSGSTPGSPRPGATAVGSSCSPGWRSPRTRRGGSSTTSSASAATWSRRRAGRCRRPWPRTAGAPRSTTRSWRWCPTTSTTGWRLRRSSTRSSSTGGSCPSRRDRRRHHRSGAGLHRQGPARDLEHPHRAAHGGRAGLIDPGQAARSVSATPHAGIWSPSRR